LTGRSTVRVELCGGGVTFLCEVGAELETLPPP
jgi:hypothetical protein